MVGGPKTAFVALATGLAPVATSFGARGMSASAGGAARSTGAGLGVLVALEDATGAALAGAAAVVVACGATSADVETSDVAACETWACEAVFFAVMGTSWVERWTCESAKRAIEKRSSWQSWR